MKLHELLPAKKTDNTYHAIIEIPAEETKVKYEYCMETGAIFVDRFMQTAFRYPCNYGFIPRTLGGDKDPIDVLVLAPFALAPGSVIEIRLVGVLVMEDEKGADEKLIALPTQKADASQAHIDDIDQINPTVLANIKHFFEHYKDLDKGKFVKVKGFQNKLSAEEIVSKAIEDFK